MRSRIIGICISMFVWSALYSQNQTQATLLEDAYQKQSETLLYKFFDNWGNDVSSNENEADNQWVAEAYKVFKAFYQPLHLERIGCGDEYYEELYKDKPYFIVQGTLYEICVTESIPFGNDELEAYYRKRIKQMYDREDDRNKMMESLQKMLEMKYIYADYKKEETINDGDWMAIPITLVDSQIDFRPLVAFRDKTIVYMSKQYELMLNNFLGDEHVDLGEEEIMQTAYAKEDSAERKRFLEKAARIFYGHWGGYWQYETYPEASSIIFDSAMGRAVVLFRIVYEGGEVYMEKRDGEWIIVSGRLTWIE